MDSLYKVFVKMNFVMFCFQYHIAFLYIQQLCFSQLEFIACVFSGRPTSSYEGKQIGNEIKIRYATYKVNICNLVTGLIKRLFIDSLSGVVVFISMALLFMSYNSFAMARTSQLLIAYSHFCMASR